MSLFTSLYPSVHSISHLTPQSDMSKILPEMLKDAGYQTAAFVAPVLSEDYGFSKGYDHYFEPNGYDPPTSWWIARSNGWPRIRVDR